MKTRGALSALCAGAILFAAACDPPGKPKPPEVTHAANDFARLYAQNCSGCHGNEGNKGPGRILNDRLYLAVLPRETLKQVLVYGRPGTSMPAWAQSEGGPLTMPEIDTLVNGIEKNWAKPVALDSPPPYAADHEGDPAAGRKLFTRSCYACHGPGARVGVVTDPSYLALVSNQMLRTSIIVGRPDLGMPDYRHLKLGKPLTSEDVTDLVAFLSSKRPAPAAGAELSAGNKAGAQAGQQAGAAGTFVSGSGTGEGARTRGNEGSGNGPGSPRKEQGEGNKSTGSSSQRGIK